MDSIALDLDRAKKYEAHSIFSSDRFTTLVAGIRLADCMKAEISYLDDALEEQAEINRIAILDKDFDFSVSDALTCSYCCTTFADKVEQRNHYKLDWHRHNLRQSLKGLNSVAEEDFDKLNDGDVSSISGSETDSSTDEDKSGAGAYQSIELTKVIRHPKIFFVNKENHVISLYRCVLHGKEDVPSSNEALYSLAQNCTKRCNWAIIMLGGGHFAAAIFDGNKPVAHKTFHSYTVRARQGGSQSARDGKSGTNHPKSAGASLRRYNEAAFQQHINDLLEVWKDMLANCDTIFLRAISSNRSLIFTGKNSILQKNDSRIRSIPFPTRRATFKEVQRVHGLLSSIEVYGPAEEFMEKFPTTPKKQNDEPRPVKESSSPDGKQKKQRIERDKARVSPSRPLPDIVQQLAETSEDGDSDDSDDELVEMTQVLDLSRDLEEFDDDVPEEMKQRYGGRKPRRRPKKKKKDKGVDDFQPKSEPIELLSDRGAEWKALLFSTRHDTQMMIQILQDVSGITEEEKILILHSSIDTRGNNLLHEAANNGLLDRVMFLLEYGLDPSVANKEGRVPYRVSKDNEIRKIFRKFQADFPNKYDYKKAEVPGPLTDEIEKIENDQQEEKKKAKRDAKKEKLAKKKASEAEKRKEEEIKRKEREEKERFLHLSDREKCALAAEKRLLATGSGTQVLLRCFICASDMSGKVPFCYQTYKFCSMECLKAHRFQPKQSK